MFSDSPEHVWVDASGQLHRHITYRDGRWLAAEVILDRSLGYGTYRFDLASPTGGLDPNVVLGLFTWSDDPAYNHREIDIEFRQVGRCRRSTEPQYVVQPYNGAGNLFSFAQPGEASTAHQFTWASNRVSFLSTTAAGRTIAARKYSGRSVPRAG